jgi:hypothetical protein
MSDEVICAMRRNCSEARNCGGAKPHSQQSCEQCSSDSNAVCITVESDESFHIVSNVFVRDRWDKQEVYAIDIRDDSNFLIDETHNLPRLFDGGDLVFGVEK